MSTTPFGPDDVKATKAAKAKRGALTAPVPDHGASGPTLRAWLAAQLRLPSTWTVSEARRHGTGTRDDRITLDLADNGRALTLSWRLGDLFKPDDLAQEVIAALGQAAPSLPIFTKADAQAIATVAVRACADVERIEIAEAARDWGRTFLADLRPIPMDDPPHASPMVRLVALRQLRDARPYDARTANDARTMLAAGEDPRDLIRPVGITWPTGEAWVRVEDFTRHARTRHDFNGNVGDLIARMQQAGWSHERKQARVPGDGYADLRLFVIPHRWPAPIGTRPAPEAHKHGDRDA